MVPKYFNGTKCQMTLIASLMNKEAFGHPVHDLKLFETHISWVILTGRFAYKIKKAVKLAFLDFSTLDLRKRYCEDELRLNRRWAPELYLEVISIAGEFEHAVVGGDGEVIEYALKMRQFEQAAQLDNQLDAGLLSCDDMVDLAATIAGYHGSGDRLPYTSHNDAIWHVTQPMLDNFPPLDALIGSEPLGHVRRWTEASLLELESVLIQRHRNGFVRECHGDLHLSNLVRLSSGITAYDCVEFGRALRTIDVISDISFLFMDLLVRRRQDLAYTLINRYLECTGDYDGMALFGLYFVYHCLIRAKIAAIRSAERDDNISRRADIAELEAHFHQALRWVERPASILVAMHGYAASGKTSLSAQLMMRLPAIRVRSDIERKRLHGMQESGSSESKPGGGIYTSPAGTHVYGRLIALARTLLSAGHNVILDAAFLKLRDRRRLERLAASAGTPCILVDTTADEKELLRRLKQRCAAGNGVSEADSGVLRYQLKTADRMTSGERQRCIEVATDHDLNTQAIIDQILTLSH